MGANKTNYNNYKLTYDYHTHTTYSHGKGSIEDNVKAAIELGLKGIGIADHGPGHLTYGVKRDNLYVMKKEIEELRVKYPQIEILMSVEANIVSVGNNLDVREDEKWIFDYLIAGYHYGIRNGYCVKNWINEKIYKGRSNRELMMNNTKMVLDALQNNDIRILTHPGDKAQFDMREIAITCAATGTLMEINTWHDHLTREELEIVKKYDVNFAVSSDAHSPARVGEVREAIKKAFDAGIEPERIKNIERIY
ncbi:MAG: PHP domain-containing protein [Clostridiales bacterium]|nr:PHP domain-containing protein [Clostridiales bacterium]